jgi:DNA-directed RNA polymerase subunit RPC12/RpoP
MSRKQNDYETYPTKIKRDGKRCLISGLVFILLGCVLALISHWYAAIALVALGAIVAIIGYRLMAGPITYYCFYCTHKLGTSVPGMCTHCGKRLLSLEEDTDRSDDGFCGNCGTRIESPTNFCTHCGTDMRK